PESPWAPRSSRRPDSVECQLAQPQGTARLATGSPPLGMSGSSTNFDGGGLGVGTGTLPGGAATSGTCDTSSSSSASSSAATSPTSPGGGARTGIPLGSVEIGNAGVSPLLVVPAPSPN